MQKIGHWLRYWLCYAKQSHSLRVRWGRRRKKRTGLEEMEHRTTALCSLQGRQECLPYLQARMAVTTWLGHGRFGSLGILGRILLLPELAQGTIGPEGVCETCGGRRARRKKFFCKTNPLCLLESTKGLASFWV